MKNCLIVDDSKVVRIFTKKILDTLPFKTEEAGDGAEALQKCKELMPDLIILDWNMPIMNGLDFLKNLRKEPDGSKPVVIFCTTNGEIEHIEKALGAGANEYIMKPFDAEIFKNKLSQVGML